MRTRLLIVCFAVVLALVAGSCSSGDDSATSDGAPSPTASGESNDSNGTDTSGSGSPDAPDDVCELLTLEDAEAAVGGIELELDEGLQDDACNYSAADPSEQVGVDLEYDAGSLAGMNLGDLADMLADDEDGVQKVDGVGDAAYAVEVISADTLIVAVGDDLITIRVIGGPDDSVPAMTTLAKAAVAKL